MRKKIMGFCFFLFFIAFKNNAYASVSGREKMRKEQYTMVIFFHLYNLDLMDEFIDRINKFIIFNRSQKFYIKICIPVAQNIEKFNGLGLRPEFLLTEKEEIYNYCKRSAPYHPEKITYENCLQLFAISEHLKEKLIIDPDKIQIIFSENRGVDVGSFLLLMDQLIKENLEHDYIVKIHTKTHKKWREELLTILDLNLSKVLRKNEYIYACNRFISSTHPQLSEKHCFLWVLPQVNKVLDYFKLPHVDKMNHSAGTMFIVSSKATTFFKDYDRIALYNQLNIGFPAGKYALLEHGVEVFFGCCFEYLQLKTLILSNFLYEKLFA